MSWGGEGRLTFINIFFPLGIFSCDLGIEIFTEEKQGKLLVILIFPSAFKINYESKCRPKEGRGAKGWGWRCA